MASPHTPQKPVARERAPRGAAVAVSIWAPVAAKAVAGVLAAVVLALIGLRAGTHVLGATPAHASVLEPASVVPASTSGGVSAGDEGRAPRLDESRAIARGASASAPADGGVSPLATLADGRVVLNVAEEADLVRLPGIGPARARAILDLRAKLKRFRSIEQLRRVKGVGRKTLQRLAPKVVLDLPLAARTEGDAG